VHQSKGESLDAVMYIASSDHAKKMLNGPDTELGRIGYVALTRAKNFFLLAVPSNAIKSIEKDLVEVGMKPFL
jgi:ATP-dependent exoDNAse (exonuclease V) beta subunit